MDQGVTKPDAPDPAPRADADRLFSELYGELRRIARARMAKLPAGDTLQPTALVHEAFLRLSRSPSGWESDGHFFATASRAMWQILVDRAREKRSLKRGGDGERAPRDAVPGSGSEGPIAPGLSMDDLVALDIALDKIGKSSRPGRIVLLRVVAGFTTEEVAEMLGVGLRTVERDWHVARLFLYTELHGDGAGS